jgi:hypothetical protein
VVEDPGHRRWFVSDCRLSLSETKSFFCNGLGIYYDDVMDQNAAEFLSDFYSGAGGEVDECSIMLRFLGDDLEPDLITELLGVPATLSYRKGDLCCSEGRPLNRPTGFWLLDCERTTDTADNQIQLLLKNDLPIDLTIWRSLTESFIAELRVHLFLARWSRGTILAANTIELLAHRGLRLQFDIYSKRPPAEGVSVVPGEA